MSFLSQRWLERTPGLEKDGFNFFGKFIVAASKWIDDDFYFPAEVRGSYIPICVDPVFPVFPFCNLAHLCWASPRDAEGDVDITSEVLECSGRLF